MANEEQSVQYTFYPEFSEFITLYRGVTNVWIADGTSQNPGDAGKLYAAYVDGHEQELGYVSDYYKAKEACGGDLTMEQWVALLMVIPDNASNSEAYAAGTRPTVNQQGEVQHLPVTPGDAAYHNNAPYYAGQAAASAISASNSKADAVTAKNQAEQWATGGSGGTPSASNNAKKYSELAADNASAASTSASNALTSEQNAAKWATGNTTGTPSSTNNAKKYSELAEESKNTAALWATGGTTGTPSSTNNAKKYSELAADSASSASQSESNASGYADNASGSASAASTSEQNAAKWATGNTSGTPSASNNAKYYSEQAASSASSIQSVQAVVKYQNSDSGTTPPSVEAQWSSTPNPVSGKYIWTRIVLNWGNDSSSTIYNVSYVGVNGTGTVDSVNGKSGNVTLYASDITMSSSDSTTIATKLTTITTAQIDSLFN